MANRSKGWIHDEAAVEEVLSSVLQPFFSEAGVALSGSGKGKSALLFKNFEKLGIQYPPPIQSSVGDCVAHSAAIAVDTLAVTEIVNGERERWIARSANEYFYHTSRMIIGKGRLGGGDGSINAWVAKGLLEYGSLRRQKYDQVNLTKYSPSLSRSWGSSRNIPDGLYEIAKQNKISRFAAIKNFQEAADALYNGYPIIVASNQGFSSKRDSDGFCKPSGSWAHSMGVLGYKDDGRPGVVIANSWPSFLPGPNEFGLPPSCFWCDADVFDRMCKFNDTFSFAGFEGFKLKPNARII